MTKIVIALLLASSSALAQIVPQPNAALTDCNAKTAGGEMVYGPDCKAPKAENNSPEYKPGMAPTALKDTVIPKSGATQTPETTPTSGVNK